MVKTPNIPKKKAQVKASPETVKSVSSQAPKTTKETCSQTRPVAVISIKSSNSFSDYSNFTEDSFDYEIKASDRHIRNIKEHMAENPYQSTDIDENYPCDWVQGTVCDICNRH